MTWQLFALGSAFFAALTAIFGKLGVAQIPSNLATFLRTIVILLICAGLVSLRGEWPSLRTIPKSTLWFLILSAVATGLSWLCYYHALQMGPASKVAPMDKLSVPLAMILAFIFLGEAASVQVICGGLLIVAGSLLIALS